MSVVTGQRRPWTLGRVVWFVVSAVLVGMLVAGVLWTQLVQPAPDMPPVVQRPAVDVSDLPVYWQQQFSTASWYGLTSVPTWDGSTLTVKTSMYPDSDAIEPAKSICVAMSMYWLGKPGTVQESFHSVRVLDQAGNVLVSRRTFGDKCTWRR